MIRAFSLLDLLWPTSTWVMPNPVTGLQSYILKDSLWFYDLFHWLFITFHDFFWLKIIIFYDFIQSNFVTILYLICIVRRDMNKCMQKPNTWRKEKPPNVCTNLILGDNRNLYLMYTATWYMEIRETLT